MLYLGQNPKVIMEHLPAELDKAGHKALPQQLASASKATRVEFTAEANGKEEATEVGLSKAELHPSQPPQQSQSSKREAGDKPKKKVCEPRTTATRSKGGSESMATGDRCYQRVRCSPDHQQTDAARRSAAPS